MEILLNSLWAMLAAAAVAGAHSWRRPSARTLCGAAVALGCALVLLFPVISVSDDLHQGNALAEDGGGTERQMRAASTHRAAAAAPGTQAAVTAPALLPLPLVAERVPDAAPLAVTTDVARLQPAGRAPPLA